MNLIKMLSNVGTQNIVDTETKNRIITVNAISSLTAAFAFILGGTFYYLTGNGKILYPALLEGVSFLCILPLNYYGFNRWAPIHAQLTHNLAMIYFGILISQAVDVTWLVAFLFGHAYFFFFTDDKREKATGIICMVIASISLIGLEGIKQLNVVEILSFTDQQRRIIRACGISVVMILIILIFIQNEKRKAKLINEKNILLQKVKEQNEQLEVKIKERTSELQIANNSILVYLREISHEIRSPLSSIVGAVKEMKKNREENNDKRINVIHSSSESALRIISNILTYEKISKGEYQKINLEPFAFAAFIVNVVNANQIIANERSVKIQLETDPQTIPSAIISDQTTLEKILNNLLFNAIKFTKKETEVILKVDVKDHVLHIIVRDHGSGIPEELLPDIFKPLGPAHRKFIGGNGIGLNLVQRLVTLLKGKIEVKSSPTGTTFVVAIPIKITTVENIPNETVQIHEDDFSDTKIVIMDDEPMSLDMANKLLTQARCTTFLANTFKEGMAKIIKHKPDIIVLDLGMEDTNRFSGLETLKNDPRTSEIPIIVMSSNAFEEDINEAFALGATEYLVKPVKNALVLNAVSKCKRLLSADKLLKDLR